MKKMDFAIDKTLKLYNVLSCKVCMNELENINEWNIIIDRLYNIIRVKGAEPIGPLIQYSKIANDSIDIYEPQVFIGVQCSKFLENIEKPYDIKSEICVKNCLYCRYIGPESNQNLVYEKLFVEAFERDIALNGSFYTIMLKNNEEDNNVVTDVFMERAET